ncbi:K(+)-transporting ATPase subunit F [Serratia marcescens]|nr:K(+)-transporting ATPase subunit F [Serratia marcescens]
MSAEIPLKFQPFLYFFYTRPRDFFIFFLPLSLHCLYQKQHLWRCPVSFSVIGGALLVLLLLAYLVYALFNAEDF